MSEDTWGPALGQSRNRESTSKRWPSGGLKVGHINAQPALTLMFRDELNGECWGTGGGPVSSLSAV